MPSDRDPQSVRELIASKDREIAALKRLVDGLSRQLYGRVMPGLYAFPADPETASPAADARQPGVPGKMDGALHEPFASYHVSEPVSVPPDLPSDEVTLELPPAKSGGMSVISYESADAIAARPAFVRRTIRRALYVSDDGSGMSAAAPGPALFPIPPEAA